MNHTSFGLDGYGTIWPAIRCGEPWNGFATPVVTRSVLASILETVDGGSRWVGDVAVIWPTADLRPDDEPDPESLEQLEADQDGNYDLGTLGWMFAEVSS